MSLRLGDTAPDFHAGSSTGPINIHDWLADAWGVKPYLRLAPQPK